MLTFTHTTHVVSHRHVHLHTHSHTRAFWFCWSLKLTVELNAGFHLVASRCCRPKGRETLLPRRSPLCPHLQIPSTSSLACVQSAPVYGLSTSCSAQDGGPGSQYRAIRAGLGSPRSTCLLPLLPVPRASVSALPRVYRSPVPGPLSHQPQDGSLCVTQTSGPSTVPAGGLP